MLLKSFCNSIDASFLVYTIDTLLYHISPVEYIVQKSLFELNDATFHLLFFSTHGSVNMKWKLSNNVTGMWQLYEAWLI